MSLTADDAMLQVLAPDGSLVGDPPQLPAADLRHLYRWMLFGRIFSDRMVALQRQGRMGTFAPLNGQEAALVAMAAPLRENDWLMGSYRESLPYMVKGASLLSQLEHWGGHIPASYPYEARCLPFQIVLATQALHCVGIAHAIKYKNEDHVAVVGVGDGATSEGDFNEALNFAAVFQVPAIFVVQDNGYAISVPRHKQTAIARFTQRAHGFGVPAILVDGNDVLAVYRAMTTALTRARSGGGPTLIEAITYRMGAHTTADDPTKYRPPAELEQWAARDPLSRYRHFLLQRNLLTNEQDEQLQDDCAAEFEAGLRQFEALPPPDPARHFELTFAEPTPQLRRQRRHLLADLQPEGGPR